MHVQPTNKNAYPTSKHVITMEIGKSRNRLDMCFSILDFKKEQIYILAYCGYVSFFIGEKLEGESPLKVSNLM